MRTKQQTLMDNQNKERAIYKFGDFPDEMEAENNLKSAFSRHAYAARLISMIKEEIESGQSQEWNLQLVTEKTKSVEKHERMLVDSYVTVDISESVHKDKKEELFNLTSKMQQLCTDLRAKLNSQEVKLRLENAELLKEAYKKQLEKEEEERAKQEALKQRQIEEENKRIQMKREMIVQTASKCGTFNGSYFQWRNFEAKFKENVHANEQLDDEAKLSILKMVCTQAAEITIKPFGESDRYNEAWTKFSNGYSNKYMQALMSINQLLLCEIKQTQKWRFKEMAEQALECVEIWKHFLENDIEACVVMILINRMSQEFYEKFESFAKAKNNDNEAIPSISMMCEFLKNEASEPAASSTQHQATVNPTASDTQHQATANPIASTSGMQQQSTWQQRAAFQQRTYATDRETAPEFLRCKLCPLVHPLFKCETFRMLRLKQKLKHIETNNICHRCLRPAHERDCWDEECGKKCERCFSAKRCVLKHNSTICPVKNRELFLASDEEA